MTTLLAVCWHSLALTFFPTSQTICDAQPHKQCRCSRFLHRTIRRSVLLAKDAIAAWTTPQIRWIKSTRRMKKYSERRIERIFSFYRWLSIPLIDGLEWWPSLLLERIGPINEWVHRGGVVDWLIDWLIDSLLMYCTDWWIDWFDCRIIFFCRFRTRALITQWDFCRGVPASPPVAQIVMLKFAGSVIRRATRKPC